MTLVPSGGWIPLAEERRSFRDEVRERFQERVGIKPFSSMGQLSLSPEQQLPLVQGLFAKANPQGSTDISSGLGALSQALGEIGLGAGGIMAPVGHASLNFYEMLPQELLNWHFLGEDADG